MRHLRILALCHKELVPPEDVSGVDVTLAPWKMDHDVIQTLRSMGHEVRPVGVLGDLAPLRAALDDFSPHVVFNLLEEFDGEALFDQNVVSYLEVRRAPYTGCNPRGLMLGRDKALSKKVLTYHRIKVPEFAVYRIGQRVRRRRRLSFPLIVKSLTEEASLGISQASVVRSDEALAERVAFIHEKIGTAAIVEQFIDGRELYVGVIGNRRLQVLPIWELSLEKLPESAERIATARVKWDHRYQKRYGIDSCEARLDDADRQRIQRVCKRAYQALSLSGYARIDIRYSEADKVPYIIEANPNPQLAYGEDFAESAERAGYTYETLLQKIVNLGMRWDARGR